MNRLDFRNRVRECPNCRRLVRLNRDGQYRRHYATDPGGRLHLCAASGLASSEVASHAPGHRNL